MTYSPLSYTLPHKYSAWLKEYLLTDSDMLAQYNNFYFYLMVALCLIAAIVVILDESYLEDWVKTVILILPVLVFLVPKYVFWLYMGISGDATFIYLFSSENVHVVFRKAFLVDALSISLVASTIMSGSVGQPSESICVCLIGMVGINLLKMWLYGLFSKSSILGAIMSFVLDCPGTLIALGVSCFVQVIIMDIKRRRSK